MKILYIHVPWRMRKEAGPYVIRGRGRIFYVGANQTSDSISSVKCALIEQRTFYLKKIFETSVCNLPW